MKTEMSFAYGKWTCNTCGYADDNGYPCYCTKCGRENTTSPKGGLLK